MSRFPFTSYPNGWFIVALSDELSPGQVLNCHYFGQDIVLYRTEQGEAHAVDPHCPHLGTHLGHGGTVVGENLRCPFHGWCFDGSGQCTEAPGSKKPPRQSIKQWHLHEANGFIYLYYHSEGAAPDWTVQPIEVESEGWSSNRITKWHLRSHPQEILENGFDTAHITVLHNAAAQEVLQAPVEEGHRIRLQVGREGSPEETMHTDMEAYGIGIFFVELTRMGFCDRRSFYPTPVDNESIDLRFVYNIRLPDPAKTEQMAENAFDQVLEFLEPDFPIWENKVYVERPPLTQADGPIPAFRKWARQFYGA